MSKEEDYKPAAAQEAVTWLSKDDAQLALFQAIQAIKLGNPTDDKMILANLREAGLWIGRYAAAPVAAAPEAVAYLDIGAGGYLDLGSNLPEVQLLALPKGRHALGIIGTYGIDGYVAAPVAAAPSVPVETLRALADRWATDRSYTGSPVDDIHALIEQPTISTPASSADSAVLTNPYTCQPCDYRDVESDPAGKLIVEPGKPLEAASTPAAPGVDIAQFKDLIGFAAWSAINLPEIDPRRDFIRQASELRTLIDASPNGGSTVVTDAMVNAALRVQYARAGSVWTGTEANPDFVDMRYILNAAMQATSTEGVTLRNDGSMSDCPIIRLAPGEYTDWEKRVWRRGVIECATQSDIAAAMRAASHGEGKN